MKIITFKCVEGLYGKQVVIDRPKTLYLLSDFIYNNHIKKVMKDFIKTRNKLKKEKVGSIVVKELFQPSIISKKSTLKKYAVFKVIGFMRYEPIACFDGIGRSTAYRKAKVLRGNIR